MGKDDFEAQIGGFGYKSLPTVEEITKKRKEEWDKATEGTGYRIYKKKSFLFWKILSILSIIGFFAMGGMFLYYLSEGKLKPEINQPINIDPENNINNEYNFNPSTQNEFKNNFSFSFNLDSELIKKYCNST